MSYFIKIKKYYIPLLLVLLYLIYALIYVVSIPHHSSVSKDIYPTEVNFVDTSKLKYLENGFSINYLIILDSPFTKQYFGNNERLDSQIINRDVFFDKVIFRPYASFANTLFKKDVGYNNCEFSDSAEITQPGFGYYFSMWQAATFLNSFSVINSRSTGMLLFNNCSFDSIIVFTKISFNANHALNLSNSTLKQGATFGWGHIERTFFENRGFPLNKYFNFAIPETLLDTIDYKVILSGDFINGKLDASNCVFRNGSALVFDHTTLPDSIDLSYSQLSGITELTTLANKIIPKRKSAWWAKYSLGNFLFSPILDSITTLKCRINLVNTDITKLDLEYKYFQLYFTESANEDQKNGVYQSLLEKFKREGKVESFQKLDIEYHNYQGGIFNVFSKYWWNYGYSKWLIFIWSAILVLIFSAFNYAWFPQISKSYSIPSIERLYTNNFSQSEGDAEVIEPNYGLKPFLACTIYTFIIFFGIKLDVVKIVFKNINYALFVLFQFLLGLVCTGFIIHLIIQ
ncbi:MAG TPA: hypothetical protein VNS58_27340 [Puia sp.]|nr:hypothetical protein [Puia sp.]